MEIGNKNAYILKYSSNFYVYFIYGYGNWQMSEADKRITAENV
jgi:hypothetical protein